MKSQETKKQKIQYLCFKKIKCIWGIYCWELQPFFVSEKMLGQIIKQSICKHQEDNKIVRNRLEIYQDQIMSNKPNFLFALDNWPRKQKRGWRIFFFFFTLQRCIATRNLISKLQRNSVNKYNSGIYGDENFFSKGMYHFLIAILGGLLRCDACE